MKAKEYCEKFGIPCDDRNKMSDALVDIASHMIFEISVLSDQRKSQKPDVVKSIIKELDDKYRAVLRICDLDKPELNIFRKLFKDKFPKVMAYVYGVTV